MATDKEKKAVLEQVFVYIGLAETSAGLLALGHEIASVANLAGIGKDELSDVKRKYLLRKAKIDKAEAKLSKSA